MKLDSVLRSLALAQATLVAPALGDSYAGKTAATLAALLLLLLAQEAEQLPVRRAEEAQPPAL